MDVSEWEWTRAYLSAEHPGVGGLGSSSRATSATAAQINTPGCRESQWLQIGTGATSTGGRDSWSGSGFRNGSMGTGPPEAGNLWRG